MEFERLDAPHEKSTRHSPLAEKSSTVISTVSTILRNQKNATLNKVASKNYTELMDTSDWEEIDEISNENKKEPHNEAYKDNGAEKKKTGLIEKIRSFVQKHSSGENVPYQGINMKDSAS